MFGLPNDKMIKTASSKQYELEPPIESTFVPGIEFRAEITNDGAFINDDPVDSKGQNFLHIFPVEIVQQILSYLIYPDLANLALTCKTFNTFLSDLSTIKQAFMLCELEVRMHADRTYNHGRYHTNYRHWRICPNCNKLLHHLKFPEVAKKLGCLNCYMRYAIKHPKERVRLRRLGYMTSWVACCENWCLDDDKIGVIFRTKDLVWRWRRRLLMGGRDQKETIMLPAEIAHKELCRRKFINRECRCKVPVNGFAGGSEDVKLHEDVRPVLSRVCSQGTKDCLESGCHFHCSSVDNCDIIDNRQNHHFHCLESSCDGVLRSTIVLDGITLQGQNLECNGMNGRHVDDGSRWEELRKFLLSSNNRCEYENKKLPTMVPEHESEE